MHAERRSEPREICFVEIMICRHMSALGFEPALMIDRSQNGARIVALQAMQPDEHFLLKTTETGVSVFVYRAMHCTELGDGRFSVGARFVRTVGEHEGG
jgi:hypothetical protein